MQRLYRLYNDESGDHSYGKKELQKWVIKLKEDMLEVPINHYPELERDDLAYPLKQEILVENKMLTDTMVEFLGKKYARLFEQNTTGNFTQGKSMDMGRCS